MSFADEREFMAFVGRDSLLPNVSSSSVEAALQGFTLPLVGGVSWEWLAVAVRRSLAILIPSVSDGPSRPSNAEVRAELVKLAEQATGAWLAIFECSGAADSQLWDYSFREWDGVNALGTTADPDFEYNRFKRALAELDWMCSFLGRAALATDEQVGNWRSAERKRQRIERGLVLAPVFEKAFGQNATANNWPSGSHQNKSAFMDFYQRMVALAFNEHATPDISGVLKAACRMHKQQPAEFAEGLIPGL